MRVDHRALCTLHSFNYFFLKKVVYSVSEPTWLEIFGNLRPKPVLDLLIWHHAEFPLLFATHLSIVGSYFIVSWNSYMFFLINYSTLWDCVLSVFLIKYHSFCAKWFRRLSRFHNFVTNSIIKGSDYSIWENKKICSYTDITLSLVCVSIRWNSGSMIVVLYGFVITTLMYTIWPHVCFSSSNYDRLWWKLNVFNSWRSILFLVVSSSLCKLYSLSYVSSVNLICDIKNSLYTGTFFCETTT